MSLRAVLTHRVTRHLSAGVVILLLLALAVRAVLPYVVLRQVNQRMAHMGAYRGSVRDVDLHLWRGAYTLREVIVEKANGKVPVPLLKAPRVDLSLSGSALLHGAVRGKATFQAPELSFVDADSEGGKQAGVGVNWRQKLEALLPIRLDEVVVHDGTVAFRNLSSTPPVDLKATNLESTVYNLTNSAGEGGSRVARFKGTANILEQARLEAAATFDPIGAPDTFEFKTRVLDVDLTRANSFVRAYSGLDVASGRGDLVMELKADHGAVSGYAKPLLRDLKVFSWKRDVEEHGLNPFRLAWQTATALAVKLFTNPAKDQFGTRVELHGTLKEKQADIPGAIFGIVRNAFIEAYKPDFESVAKEAKLPEGKGSEK